MINRSVKDKLSVVGFVLQEFREKHEKHFFDAGGNIILTCGINQQTTWGLNRYTHRDEDIQVDS